MPKLWTITQAINGDETAIELLGVQEYSVEMVGTNTDVEELLATYYLNVPADPNFSWVGEKVALYSFPSNLTLNVGANAIITVDGKATKMQDITFNNRYKFKYWCETKDGTGFKYIDGNEYMLKQNVDLYAIWEKGAQ